MAIGVGSFTQGVLNALKQDGAEVFTYLNRDYAHFSPSLEGETFLSEMYPNPCDLIENLHVDLVMPMSIDWSLSEWTNDFIARKLPIFSPDLTGMLIERDRDFSREICQQYNVPFPESYVASNRLEAVEILKAHKKPFVIKNTLCSPTSPIHTIVCETPEDTMSWLDRLDYAEGVFLQEYMGRREIGHIAFISNGEIVSLITNQEYKRAFNGNMGIVAGAPLGGLVEQDPDDKYNIAKELLHPLLPWFREVNFHGPIQVTGIWDVDHWSVLEYNVRIGITCGPIILKMLRNPMQTLLDVIHNRKLNIEMKEELKYGCSLTLAGYGYPYIQVHGPLLPVQIREEPDCDVWWNEVMADTQGQLHMTGHRIADIIGYGDTLEGAIQNAYSNIKKIYCVGSYYRTDIGDSLWPPGNE